LVREGALGEFGDIIRHAEGHCLLGIIEDYGEAVHLDLVEQLEALDEVLCIVWSLLLDAKVIHNQGEDGAARCVLESKRQGT
jgi:hypothetical protein